MRMRMEGEKKKVLEHQKSHLNIKGLREGMELSKWNAMKWPTPRACVWGV